MIASKSSDHQPHFDTFTCLNCGTVVSHAAARPKPGKPPQS
jgi:hypothetical protein